METIMNGELQCIEQEIIIAARRVFVKKGYNATSMNDIAKEVGIGRTGLHYYYRTKTKLFDAVICDFANMLLPNIGKIVDMESSILEKIPHIVELYIDLLQRNPDVPLFVINELNRDSKLLINAITKQGDRVVPLKILHDLIIQEMECGTILHRPIIDIVTTFLSLTIFPFVIRTPLSLILNDEISFERRKRDITQMLTEYLTK